MKHNEQDIDRMTQVKVKGHLLHLIGVNSKEVIGKCDDKGGVKRDWVCLELGSVLGNNTVSSTSCLSFSIHCLFTSE